MQIIFKPFILIMEACYGFCKNYGLAIIVFTLLSKIILLPLSIWLQVNSIKMVKMEPELNFMKAKFFGDKERIANEEAAIYKKYTGKTNRKVIENLEWLAAHNLQDRCVIRIPQIPGYNNPP